MSKKNTKVKAKPAAKKAAPKKPAAKAKPAAKKPAAKKPVKKAAPKAKPAAKKPAPKKPVAKAKPAPKKATPKAAPKAKAKPVAKAPAPAPAPKKPEVKAKIKVKPEPKPARVPEKNPVLPPMPPPIKPAISKDPISPLAKITHEDPNKTRYSDSELDEFREIIEKKLEDSRRELTLLQAQLTAANDHGTDDTASTFKMLEDGSESLAKEEAGQLASRQKKFIEQLENALVRIENKTYGICRVTGKLIPKERLRAVPHTTQSIEAKMNQYRD